MPNGTSGHTPRREKATPRPKVTVEVELTVSAVTAYRKSGMVPNDVVSAVARGMERVTLPEPAPVTEDPQGTLAL